jgi:type I restriction enzyme M protein
MFSRLEELVLANSGEDEFEEVFKLIIAKLWDERMGGTRFRSYADAKQTFETITILLREAEKEWKGIVEPFAVPALTPEHLQICVDAMSRHLILSESLDVMDGFFEFIVSRTAKGAKGQYFTPRHVVEFCIRVLKPNPNETVLDPACGSGGFLIHALNYVAERHQLSDSQRAGYCKDRLWGFDIDARAVRVAKALMILAGDGKANLIRLNSLFKPAGAQRTFPTIESNGLVLTVEDVCRSRLRRHKGFDIIATNPPVAGEVREKQILNEYAVANRKPRIERDILFLERCVELLRPGGRLAIVLPHNKFASGAFAQTRQWLLRKTRILGVVGLGRNTFLPHTHQKASILFAKKRTVGEDVNSSDNIFFAVSERDGKNSKGQLFLRSSEREGSVWDRVDHDLADVVTSFEEFCSAEHICLA